MKVIVTGATGFIGGAIARRYAERGADVIGVGRNREAGRLLADAGVEFLEADLAESGIWMGGFRSADVVVHCAGRASLAGTPDMFERANVTATEHVLDACVQGGVGRLVQMSSPSIYQTGRDRLDIRESDPLPDEFINPYAATKWRAEELVAARSDDVESVTLRPRAVFGPGDTSIVPRIIKVMQTGRLRVIGDGANLVDVTHIENLVDATVLAAETDEPGGAYNITNGEPIPIWDFVGRIADGLDLPRPKGRIPHRLARKLAGAVEDVHRRLKPTEEPPVTRYGVDSLGLAMTLDISSAREELGYEPRVSVEEGLADLLDHYRENGNPGGDMTKVELTILEAGSCTQLETFVLGTRSVRTLRFPALYALIRHPDRGTVLFDAGYSRHVVELTERLPERVYRLTLPFELPATDDPLEKLGSLGVEPDDVRSVIISHFHLDHVGALRDLPLAEFIFHEPAWNAVKDLGRFGGLRKAYLPELIPDDFDRRARPYTSHDFEPLDESYAPFERAFDVFGDGSLKAVEIPGHATGQTGLFVETQDERVFLCADACWTTRSFVENVLPTRIADLVFDDWDEYARSLEKVHRFHRAHPDVRIIPSHCQQALEQLPPSLRP